MAVAKAIDYLCLFVCYMARSIHDDDYCHRSQTPVSGVKVYRGDKQYGCGCLSGSIPMAHTLKDPSPSLPPQAAVDNR
jgi:hypothetical protein